MSLILSGTDGLSDVDGSAATPAIRGTDSNTGVFFPAADTVAIATGGTERARVDSAGNVGIGTSSPTRNLVVNGGASEGVVKVTNNTSGTGLAQGFEIIHFTDGQTQLINRPNGPMLFYTNNTERARITSGGDFWVNTTTAIDSAYKMNLYFASGGGITIKTGTNGDNAMGFRNSSGTSVGAIVINASATAYNTSSDYRLKNTIAPMTGALAKVALLKPVTYKWNADGSDGEGFIAHELAEVVPACVTGEKDAVNEDGTIKPQGIDTSFLVATLTAAIQELNAKVEALEAQLAGAAS